MTMVNTDSFGQRQRMAVGGWLQACKSGGKSLCGRKWVYVWKDFGQS